MRHLLNSKTIALCIVFALALLPVGVAGPARAYPVAEHLPLWEAVDGVRGKLFEAQQVLLRADRADSPAALADEAVSHVEAAADLYGEALAPRLAAPDPADDARIQQTLADAEAAAGRGDSPALAAARGRLYADLLRAAYHRTLEATAAGDPQTADDWARVREFRTATRVSLVDNPAAAAIGTLGEGQLSPEAAVAVVGDDLRDAYFFRLREALGELDAVVEQRYPSRAAEWGALAEGYFLILEDDFSRKQGEDDAQQVEAQFEALNAAVLEQDWQAVERLLGEVEAGVQPYQPVELGAEDIQQKGQLLYIFTDLVAVEYRDGVRNGHVTIETEYREALTFRDQAEITYQELRPVIAAADAQQADRLGALLSEMQTVMVGYGDSAQVEAAVEEALGIVEATLGEAAAPVGNAGLFTAIHSVLGELSAAVAQGDYDRAEQLRIQAYALYDFGPELSLLGVAPRLVAEGDGLMWYGVGGQEGLAAAVARRAAPAEIDATLTQLRATLDESEQVLYDKKTSRGAVIFNAAAIVFREGLEAVIILAALLASMVKPAYKPYRKPLVAGSVLALVATVLTWLVTRQVLISLSSWGERLEAIVSLVAIAVLLLITNWFFHKVYWKDWMARFHQMKGSLLSAEVGQLVGLVFLGFTSVYREGFETVLFLQALALDAGSAVVFEGVAVGLVGVAIIGVLTFSLQRKLPYMHMLVATGMLIGLVLVTMVGGTVRTLQAVGWMPISPIYGFQPPYWLGLWFGVYPTWQGVAAQVAAVVFVLGSYFWVEAQKKRNRKAVVARSHSR